MKQILIIHLNDENNSEVVHFLDQEVQIQRKGCGGDPEIARALIAEYDGKVDAIGLDGLPATLELGSFSTPHEIGQKLRKEGKKTAVVDGSGIRAGLERWAVILADRAQPGIFAQKHILMVPGLNHPGLTQALSRRSPHVRYADPVVYFALPQFPGIGSKQTFNRAAPGTLEQLDDEPFRRIKPQAGTPGTPRAAKPFAWADILAGDIGAIRRYAPANLKRKTVVVECASPEDVADMRERGVSILITLMPCHRRPKPGPLVGRRHRSHARGPAHRSQCPPQRRHLPRPHGRHRMDTRHPLPATRRSRHQPFRLRHPPPQHQLHPQRSALSLDTLPAQQTRREPPPPTCGPCTSPASPAANRPPPARKSKAISFPSLPRRSK